MPAASIPELLSLYEFMLMARRMDELERQTTNRGLAHFHVSGIGHEASAALAFCLEPQDWLHCHYRDKALMLARGLTPLDFFLGLLCKKTSASQGRQMSAHMASRAHNVLSIVGPVGNNALQAVGIAAAITAHPGAPIVIASMGEGTTQQGEVLEALAEASRSALPVLFLVHDNGFAISTRTAGKTFFSLADGTEPDSFMGIPIIRLNGSRPEECLAGFRPVVSQMRVSRRPAIMILQCERMDDHSNADDQRAYRNPSELEQTSMADPVANLQSYLNERGITPEKFEFANQRVSEIVGHALDSAIQAPEPKPCLDADCNHEDPPFQMQFPLFETSAEKFATANSDAAPARVTMLEALRETLRLQLAEDDSVVFYGQDIDDPKGDVFGLTRGLGRQFAGRVLNAPLSESTIVGTSIGRALAGQRPVAFIQFADFLPMAWNQISQELATMRWRTAGQYEAPVIVMAVCGGYKAGLGPFHAQTSDSMSAHVPGIDVMVPSNPVDAADLLAAAFHSRRPTVFLYPKSCLNDRGTAAMPSQFSTGHLERGKAKTLRKGNDLTVVSWGGAVAPSAVAAEHAASFGVQIELIDLRTLAPWDRETVTQSARRTGRLLVVHEDNLTGGFGAEVIAGVIERTDRPIKCRRVTRPDTHIPCNFANQLEILPNPSRILSAIAELMDMELIAQADRTEGAPHDPHTLIVNAFGTSPSDDQVTIIKWHVKPGDAVVAGQTIAETEADKASGEIDAPVAGIISRLLVARGETVRVGKPLFHLKTESPINSTTTSTLPELRRRLTSVPDSVPLPTVAVIQRIPHTQETNPSVNITLPAVTIGSSALTNDALAQRFTHVDAARILEKTGIESRPMVSSEESAFSMAWDAVSQTLSDHPFLVSRLEMIVCSTSSVSQVCPSIACRILARIQKQNPACQAQAFDILATCSGYLYALQIACDYLVQRPDASVLVVTAEELSPLVDPADFGSCISFGDAATATWCTNASDAPAPAFLRMERPLCFSQGDGDSLLTVPPMGGDEKIVMQGASVRKLTVPAMGRALRMAAAQSNISVGDLDLVIPHQTNQRIINDLAAELAILPERMFLNLRKLGNTSSCTLPLALNDFARANHNPGARIGFTTFGGGFTYAAAIGHLH